MANKDWCRGGDLPIFSGTNYSIRQHVTIQNLGVKGPAIRGHNNYRNSRQKSFYITPIWKRGGTQCLPAYSGPHPPMRPAKEERRIQKFDREGTGGVGMGVVPCT